MLIPKGTYDWYFKRFDPVILHETKSTDQLLLFERVKMYCYNPRSSTSVAYTYRIRNVTVDFILETRMGSFGSGPNAWFVVKAV